MRYNMPVQKEKTTSRSDDCPLFAKPKTLHRAIESVEDRLQELREQRETSRAKYQIDLQIAMEERVLKKLYITKNRIEQLECMI